MQVNLKVQSGKLICIKSSKTRIVGHIKPIKAKVKAHAEA